ncbi:hypothetical protein LQ236_000276 [Nitrospina gracilis]|nr:MULTISPECIES: hypothetical protein [Nitrospina]MCF8722256.1 hypothetical protein [Nitrospina sp. Nb-3]
MTDGPHPSAARTHYPSLPGVMSGRHEPDEDKYPPLSEKEKREAYSVYIAAIGVLIIIISFFWNIVSLLFGGGE